MPAAFFMDGTVPVVMIAEWTGAAILCTFSVESCIAVIALNSIRYAARRRRSNGGVANARKIFIGWWEIIFRVGAFQHVLKDTGTVWGLVLRAKPWKVRNPLVMKLQLGVQFLEGGK